MQAGASWHFNGIFKSMKYSTLQTATMFSISRETVRLWTEEFAAYLSPTATPSQGRHRQYTDEDMTVFALIHRMKGEGSVYEDIHIALRRGDREQPPNTLDLALPEGTKQQIALMQAQILAIQEERDRAIQERDEAITQRRIESALREESKEQLAIANERIEKLLREIGKLEAKIDNLK